MGTCDKAPSGWCDDGQCATKGCKLSSKTMSPLQAYVDEQLEQYECRADNGDYTPNDQEQMLMADFVYGLLAEPEFLRLCGAQHSPVETSVVSANDVRSLRLQWAMSCAPDHDDCPSCLALDRALMRLTGDLPAKIEVGRNHDPSGADRSGLRPDLRAQDQQPSEKTEPPRCPSCDTDTPNHFSWCELPQKTEPLHPTCIVCGTYPCPPTCPGDDPDVKGRAQ